MANTTNYNWETPDDTDLVKDGAAAIRTLGSSVDTTTKALNPSTTLGDIEYRSATANTNTRLAIGTTGQVLTVAGGVPTWATSDDANAIQNALLTTTGDTIYASGASTPARLGIGSTGQVLTVAGGVPSWATPAAGGTTFVGASVYNSAAQSIANNTLTALTWNTESFDTDAFHSTATNTERMTIPAGKAGYYLCIAGAGIDSSTTGVRFMRLRKNGSVIQQLARLSASPGGNQQLLGSFVVNLAVADYVDVAYQQNSGTSQDADTTIANGFFTIQYLGA